MSSNLALFSQGLSNGDRVRKTVRNLRLFLSVSLVALLGFFANAQNGYISGSTLLVSEKKDAQIYGNGNEQRTSNTINLGAGIRLAFVRGKIRFGSGVLFITRHYRMSRPYDHCYFNMPGQPCDFILAHVDRYLYRTLEIPLSVDCRVLKKGRLTAFIGVSYRNAFLYSASYHAYYPATGTKKESHSLTRFSTSMNCQISVNYKINEKISLSAEPFVRIHCKQRADQILMEQTPDWQSSSFDSFGLLVEFTYRI